MNNKKKIIAIVKQADDQKERLDRLLNTAQLSIEQKQILTDKFLRLSAKINRLLDTALDMSDAEQTLAVDPQGRGAKLT